MAIFKYSLSFMDGGGVQTPMEGTVVATDVTAATAKIRAIAEKLNSTDPMGDASEPGLTNGALVEAHITVPLSLVGWDLTVTPADESENQKGGRFLWRTVNGFPTKFTVPTFNEAYKHSSGYLVGTGSSPALLQFIQEVTLQGSSDQRGEDIIVLHDSYFTYGGKPAYK